MTTDRAVAERFHTIRLEQGVRAPGYRADRVREAVEQLVQLQARKALRELGLTEQAVPPGRWRLHRLGYVYEIALEVVQTGGVWRVVAPDDGGQAGCNGYAGETL